MPAPCGVHRYIEEGAKSSSTAQLQPSSPVPPARYQVHELRVLFASEALVAKLQLAFIHQGCEVLCLKLQETAEQPPKKLNTGQNQPEI